MGILMGILMKNSMGWPYDSSDSLLLSQHKGLLTTYVSGRRSQNVLRHIYFPYVLLLDLSGAEIWTHDRLSLHLSCVQISVTDEVLERNA